MYDCQRHSVKKHEAQIEDKVFCKAHAGCKESKKQKAHHQSRFSALIAAPYAHYNPPGHHACKAGQFHCGETPISISKSAPDEKPCEITSWDTKEREQSIYNQQYSDRFICENIFYAGFYVGTKGILLGNRVLLRENKERQKACSKECCYNINHQSRR